MQNDALNLLIEKHWPDLEAEKREKLVRHFDLILEENKIQNLTRLTDAEDYFWNQLWDVREFSLHKDLHQKKNLDIGSGSGHPGMACAIVSGGEWTLSDSEKRKADFLSRASVALELPNVKVYPGRAETHLRSHRFDLLTAKAVANTQRLITTFGKCSTWNIFVLFKSGKFREEWDTALAPAQRIGLRLSNEYTYQARDRARTLAVVTR